jgi:hypothetical protein
MARTIPADIRAELDQTPEWWDRKYRELKRAAFPPKPFDPADHDGHDIVEVMTFGAGVVARYCAQCRPDDD